MKHAHAPAIDRSRARVSRRRRTGALPFLVVLAVMGCMAPPARAASQAVSVSDNFFAAPRVAVKPGESVTWTASGGNPHNVAFEDGLLVAPTPPIPAPWSTSRTFAASGTYRYFCQVHGSPNGLGMAGIVFVNAGGNVPPVAFFATTPSTGQPGQPVGFNASSSSDADGTIDRYEWDLDGNGSFETDTGPVPTTARTYASPATIAVKLRVTDNAGSQAEVENSLRINAPPSASFTISRNPVAAGAPVTFNGSGSADSEGRIAQYEWDLDGNGSFETNLGSAPTTSRSYATPGTLTIRLRVTDAHGSTAETSRSLEITPRSVLAPGLGGAPAAGTTAPLPPSFASGKRSIKVSKTGRFSYSFRAEKGLTGTIGLRSASKVGVGARRWISLGARDFRVPADGIVKVSWKLSRKNLKVLKVSRRIRFHATATLRNAAGQATSGATTLTLRKPTG